MIRLALIGHPVGHSLSKTYFDTMFQQKNIEGNYELHDLTTIDQLPALLERENLNGFNVTLPYKLAVIPFCNQLTETARSIGAVNAVRIDGDRLTGHNTDAEGFADAIKPLLLPHHDRVLIIGNGGAARAVAFACTNLLHLPYEIICEHRNTNDFERSTQLIPTHTVIVNCTPLGMHPNEETLPQINYNEVTSQHLLFDLVYAPATTQFMKQGMKHGATVANGLKMMHAQADAAWRFWNHKSTTIL